MRPVDSAGSLSWVHGAEVLTLIARVLASILPAATLVALFGAPSFAAAQAPQRPADPNAKWMLVEVFRATGKPERDLGTKAAESMRRRIEREISRKEVYLIPSLEMKAMLEASGFPVDVPLEPHDARALAAQLRADEYIAGEVFKDDTGAYKVQAHLVLTRDNTLVQPLGELHTKKMDDALQGLAAELKMARAQLPHEQKCINEARQRNWDAAAAAARAGIEVYPKAVLARVCLANVMVEQKVADRELLKVATEITDIYPNSRPGLSLRAQAFRALDMPDSAITALATLLTTNPNDARLQKDVIEAISAFGNPRAARPIVEEAVARNPGDSDLLRLRWLILLAVRDYKEAFEAGEELVRLDTAFADTTYFVRTAAAYAADSQPQKAAETAARGVAKFPENAGLNFTLVAALRSSGQSQQALEVLQRATAAGIKVEDAGLLRVALTRDLGDEEGAIRLAVDAIKGGDVSPAPQLLAIGNARYQKANASKVPEDFDAAIAVIDLADEYNKGELKVQAKFLKGAASVFAAQYRITGGAEQRNCEMVRKGKEQLVDAQINLPAGGQFQPQAVPQLMGLAAQLDGYADQAIKAICR